MTEQQEIEYDDHYVEVWRAILIPPAAGGR
jgi:hypothetical protein